MNKILYSTEAFQPFTSEHLISFIIFATMGTLLIFYGQKSNEKTQRIIYRTIASILSAFIFIWAIIEIMLDRFFIESDLPLVFCNFVATIIPIHAFKRTRVGFNIFYYIIIAGAIQAIITPALKFSFPHYEYLKFWTVHVGLITLILYEIFVFGERPCLRGVFQAFIATQIYLLFVMFVNFLLDSNYLFLNEKPENVSVLDLFGDWPNYILVVEVALIPYFLLAYLPFWIRKKYT